jgi:DNA adenine methylase
MDTQQTFTNWGVEAPTFGRSSKKLAPVIKWSGSKGSQSTFIVGLFPAEYRTYYEPFVGSGAILYSARPGKAVAGDICAPLIALWKTIQTEPQKLIDHYTLNWNRLKNEGYLVYYEVRDRFNQDQDPRDLFFLSRTCVNGLIRFNRKGEFNNSLHHTRSGIEPTNVAEIILDWGRTLSHIEFRAGDYRETSSDATSADLVYLDPPYFNTKGQYYGRIDYDKFLEYLDSLNKRNIRFILSYDGTRGKINYQTPLPSRLYKRKFLVKSGNSPFRKVMDKETEMVEEALYLNW